jgi:hypothetical protein
VYAYAAWPFVCVEHSERAFCHLDMRLIIPIAAHVLRAIRVIERVPYAISGHYLARSLEPRVSVAASDYRVVGVQISRTRGPLAQLGYHVLQLLGSRRARVLTEDGLRHKLIRARL